MSVFIGMLIMQGSFHQHMTTRAKQAGTRSLMWLNLQDCMCLLCHANHEGVCQ